MLKKIIKGYGNLLFSTVKILLLILLCAVCGCILVFPLWKFAVSQPELYSMVIGILMVAVMAYLLVRKVQKYLVQGDPERAEKHKRIRNLLIMLGKIIVCLTGIVVVVISVLNGLFFATIVTIIVTVVLYGILAFGTRNGKKKK